MLMTVDEYLKANHRHIVASLIENHIAEHVEGKISIHRLTVKQLLEEKNPSLSQYGWHEHGKAFKLHENKR